MSSPLRTTHHDEPTVAATGGRPAPEFVSETSRATVFARVAAMLHRVHLPAIGMPAAPANEPDIHDSKLLERYY
jgi:hypothetical protein